MDPVVPLPPVVAAGAWQASPSRTIEIAGPVVYERGLGSAPVPLVLAAMASADVLDYAMDVSHWLRQEGDTLHHLRVSVAAPVLDTDLQVLWATVIEGHPVFLLAGGTPGSLVPIEVTLDSTTGRRLVQLLRLPINTDSPATVPPSVPQMLVGGAAQGIPPNAMRLPGGAVLVNDAGLPFLLA